MITYNSWDIYFSLTLTNSPPSLLAEYFLMRVLYFSSSLVRPISDILVYIGCSFTVILGNSAFYFFALLTIALGPRAIFSIIIHADVYSNLNITQHHIVYYFLLYIKYNNHTLIHTSSRPGDPSSWACKKWTFTQIVMNNTKQFLATQTYMHTAAWIHTNK